MSVVIAVYNGERYLPDSIASVLVQTSRSLECVVVDDGSTDRTPEVVAAFPPDPRLRYTRTENRGVAAARNLGISMARGSVVAFLDADDVWLPEKLGRQLTALVALPGPGLVYCGYVITDDRLRPQGVVVPGDTRGQVADWFLLQGEGIGLGCTGLVSREVLEHDGGFDERLSTSADLELAWRLASRRPVAAIAAPLALYRAHRDQMHRHVDAFEHDMRLLFDAEAARGTLGVRALRRGRANLATRIFYYELAAGRPRAAARAAGLALRSRPDRFAMLPFEGLARRARRRSRLAGHAPSVSSALAPVQEVARKVRELVDVAPPGNEHPEA